MTRKMGRHLTPRARVESIGCTANWTEKRRDRELVARKNAVGGPWKFPGARLISGKPIRRRFRCVHPKSPFRLLLSLFYRHCRPLLNRRLAHRALHLRRLLPLPPHRRSTAQPRSRVLGIFPAPRQVWTKSEMMEFRQKPSRLSRAVQLQKKRMALRLA